LESTVLQSTISGHLAQKRKSRDEDSEFTRELILHVPNVHIYLVVREKVLIQVFLTSIRTVKKHDFVRSICWG
jgi:hypothetical protein